MRTLINSNKTGQHAYGSLNVVDVTRIIGDMLRAPQLVQPVMELFTKIPRIGWLVVGPLVQGLNNKNSFRRQRHVELLISLLKSERDTVRYHFMFFVLRSKEF